ncbi:hypothetical protein D3C80_1782120 [compost metagenome]
MLEIALVEAPRCQQDHQWRLVVTRRKADEGVLQGAEETGQMLHLQVAVQLGQSAGNDDAIFQGITGTGGRLRAVGGNPPAAIRRPCQVHGIDVQKGAVGRADALAGPEEIVVSVDQLARQ